MSTLRPLRALRYNTSQTADVSTRIAPPYDVLDEAAKAALIDRDPHNFVVVDLPHTPPKDAGPQHLYDRAAATLARWIEEGILVRDPQPALYVYHQLYTHGGRRFTRKMFFATLRLEPFGEGSVYPHERTFGGPKEDRLALMKATQAQLSPIFGLYEDTENSVAQRLESRPLGAPLAAGTADGVENHLWALTDAQTIAEVTRLMAARPIYIADGHHRYGTALLYRDWLAQQRGPLPPDHPANFVLCVFCAMEDPGALILPTHRVLPGIALTPETFASPRITAARMTVSGPDAAVVALAAHGPLAVALYTPRDDAYTVLRPADEGILDPLEPDHSPAWRRLGLAFLHAYLLDRIVTPGPCAGTPPKIDYLKSADAAVAAARRTAGSAFLLQPNTMAELRDVCTAGDLMPQKSTYFFPKLASGLVVQGLAE